ncbi:hypothetical protein [Paenibacillus sp. KS-LC4]|uniref:hypothetical protein n=1 Tax=Paenibacillus sp. KS-LC4 TaxID=2979727 RepID=UPI0030CE7FB7
MPALKALRWIATELSGGHRLKRAKADMPKLAESGTDRGSGLFKQSGTAIEHTPLQHANAVGAFLYGHSAASKAGIMGAAACWLERR